MTYTDVSIISVNGKSPQIDPSAFIAPGCRIIGDVTIGPDVSIWYNCVLRADVSHIVVGARSNIQEGVVVHTDPGKPVIIGEGCTIGHGAIIHGCTIGNNSLIGMGATVLNGAVIGNNCLVGANALVTEGKVFPDNSLIVGSPAKAVRTLDAQAVEGLKRSAESYVRNWQRFKAGLKRLDE